MKLSPTTVRARLTLWFGAAVAAALLLFAAVVFIVVRTSLTNRAVDEAKSKLAAVAKFVEDNPGDVAELAEFNPEALVLVLKAGRVEHKAVAWDRLGLPASVELGAQSREWLFETPGDHHYRLAAKTVETAGRMFTVAAAVDEEPLLRGLATLAWTFGLSIPAVLAGAALAGFWLGGRMLAPARRMALAAERISAERLGERLPVDNPHDEFGRLATITNRSLDRLRETIERQRRFTADASHEIRTPLTAIRAAGEVALRSPQSPEQYREAIGAMLEGVARLTDLAERLLVLACADSGRYSASPEALDAAGVAREVADLLGPLADDKALTLAINTDHAAPVHADRFLLRQAVMNLVDNAIKYTPHGGRVEIAATSRDGSVRIAVRDSGPGIADEHRGRVFERFYRVDPSRAGSGAGLGLAIAKWAVEAGGGRIALDSELGHGSTFTIILPAPARTARTRDLVPGGSP
jgi:heavy metal sensor kinase